MLEDSPVVRSLKLGGLGLTSGFLSVASPALPALGYAQPGVVLGLLLVGYFIASGILDLPRGVIPFLGTAFSAGVSFVAAFLFQLGAYGVFMPPVPAQPTTVAMIVGGAVGAACIAGCVLPAATGRPRRLGRPFLLCVLVGSVMGGVGYALCFVAGDHLLESQAENWPGLAPLFVVWPIGITAALGWFIGEDHEFRDDA